MALTLSAPKQDRPLLGFLRLRSAPTPEDTATAAADDDDTLVFRSTRSRPLEAV